VPARFVRAMSTQDPRDPLAATTTLVLAASLLMEDTSAELIPTAEPTAEQLTEKVQLLADTADQLQALARAAQAALKQLPQ